MKEKNNRSDRGNSAIRNAGIILAASVLLSSCRINAENTVKASDSVRSVNNPAGIILPQTNKKKGNGHRYQNPAEISDGGEVHPDTKEAHAAEAEQKTASSPEPVINTASAGGSQTRSSYGGGDEARENESPNSSDNLGETAHTHNWTDLTETVHHPAATHTVHHDAVTEERWVWDGEPWDETIYTPYNICNVCGFREGMDEDTLFDHIENEHGGHASYHYEKVADGTVHHDGSGHYESFMIQEAYDETVTDQEAWDETVVTGQICTGCGATK